MGNSAYEVTQTAYYYKRLTSLKMVRCLSFLRHWRNLNEHIQYREELDYGRAGITLKKLGVSRKLSYLAYLILISNSLDSVIKIVLMWKNAW